MINISKQTDRLAIHPLEDFGGPNYEYDGSCRHKVIYDICKLTNTSETTQTPKPQKHNPHQKQYIDQII